MGFALFFATIYPESVIMWAPCMALWIIQRPRLRFYNADLLMGLFLSGVIVQTMIGLVRYGPFSEAWSPGPFGFLMLIPCMLIGRSLGRATVRWLLVFICLEAAVCVLQLLLRQPYIFAGQRDSVMNAGVTEWGSNDLLYFNRMYGLSTNSSVAAQKFMLGMLLLFEKAGSKMRGRLLAFALFSVGLYATFNRTALLVTGFFFFTKALQIFIRAPAKRKLQAMAIMGIAIAAVLLNWSILANQFLRGKPDASLVDDSGRGSLWDAAREAIIAHPIEGNLSQRYMIYEYGGWFHLHSTWLQLIVDHGLVGWLLIAHTFSLVRRQNINYFSTISLYSFVQFGLFGKISLINIVFYYLMRKEPFRVNRTNHREITNASILKSASTSAV